MGSKKNGTARGSAVKIPEALRAYYNRIGAEVVSPRRAKVWDDEVPPYGNQRWAKATIKIDSQGNVTVDPKNKAEEFGPTDEEAAAIKQLSDHLRDAKTALQADNPSSALDALDRAAKAPEAAGATARWARRAVLRGGTDAQTARVIREIQLALEREGVAV